MSIPMNFICYQCHLRRTVELAAPHASEEALGQLSRELMQMYLDFPRELSSPNLGPKAAVLLEKYAGLKPDRLRPEMDASNRFALERIDDIRARIEKAADPVYAALQFSVLGNYLDFAALQGRVSFDQLDEMLDKAQEMDLDKQQYQKFRADMEKTENLLYLTDNAGEIVFDRVFAEYLRKTFPNVQITFCVRGAPVHNDATRTDAIAAGIDFPVIDSGSCIGGTELTCLGKEAAAAVSKADVIIAKGMGNTETLAGCGLNVYYAFLVKCPRFVSYFGKPMMTPMFVAERQ
jgi:uncharacterized protein with ATP-grasp and redox domains